MKSSHHFLLVLAMLGSSAVGLAASGPAVAGGTPLTWRGDIATARGFVDAMAATWHRDGHPRMILEPFNTISALDQLSAGKVDIAGSARGRSPRRPQEQDLHFTPVAWDALVIITNPRNPVHGLTLKQLHDIYFGKIRNWSQVGGPNRPIDVYADASPTDGIEFSLRKLLYGRGNQPVAAPRLYLTVRSLEQGVALDPDSIGVSTLSGVYGNRQLKMLAIAGVKPSMASVADASYPLYTPLYLVTRDHERNRQAQAFVHFATSATGQRILRRHHLLPYADGTRLEQRRPGQMARIANAVGRKTYTASRAAYVSGADLAPTSHD